MAVQPASDTTTAKPMRKAVKHVLVAAGWLNVALAVAGVILPGLPTTPFVLLAGACFAKGSPRAHRWLLQHRLFGPMVRDWEANRNLPLKVKWLSTILMTTMVLLSAWRLNGQPGLQGLVLGLGVMGAWVVWRIPTRHAATSPPKESDGQTPKNPQ